MASKSVESLLDDIRLVNEERYQVASQVRELVRKSFKPFAEEVKYGGILFASDVHFSGVFVYKDHVSVEFGNGAKIQDPFGHLEGTGKLRRHVKLRIAEEIKTKCVAEYLQLALAAAKSQ